jgi:uncharacterized membrane protein
MRILLFNNNPVIDKLVTLSAQKTSDELDIIHHIDEIVDSVYDLLVVDDSVFYDGLIEQIKTKIKYDKSLFISDKNSDVVIDFTTILRKPFLPTELVEQFLDFKRQFLSDIENKLEDEFSNDFFDEDTPYDLHGESILNIDEVQEVQELLEETEEFTEDSSKENLESLIQSALEELSEEELNSVVDKETLLDITQRDTDFLDILDVEADEDEETSPDKNNDIIALKNLLNALSDKKVAASLNGMKISINITLGDRHEQ